ncbi:MAG: CoB-CoM heterodisulfide reductase HdrA2 [Candidatus Bathyarchaeota archaeon]|jgi:heterodisulfide reductase subunit A|nr:hydrogenase iron-sulfur subunit [Candidatus Bathyarchaeota archaeon A05DMB-5]MDH7557415.1 CoB-CoM heterodisulfide reductase HdrA2 [Candidatus Bathyarchaeota archaeon]
MAENKTQTTKETGRDVRIGVYVCHCGLNIAGSVDCEEVAKFASTLPHVVLAKDNRYTCSDQGQEQIKNDIKEHKLNRVVVASCSPRLHEPTFRKACEEAGLNKYLFEMANIREHCSWVHLHDHKAATEKAKDLVKMAVAKAALLQPAEEIEVPIIRKALVIGGGVAGIQASLDLADTGYQVYLVEKEPSIGGMMARIDKTFPTMDCSICILAPKMSDVGHHPNIELLTNSEVTEVKGYIGNFRVKVLKKPRYVTKDCSACGECTKVCPVVAPNEFDVGLAIRHAIYTPFAQAVPSTYIIDMNLCLNKDGVIVCDKCMKACERQAIKFEMKTETVELEVGTIIVATGADVFDPSTLPHYGYGRYPNVITSLEFERLINAGGPSHGHLIRPSDKQIPKRVAFVQCVGSRSDRNGRLYCSNVCCMNTIKDSLLIKEHWPETEIYVFYVDIRAYGKGFEDLYKRARREGVKFIRGLPSEILEDKRTRNLWLVGENTLQKELYKMNFDMVILSIGLEPRKDSEMIQRLLTLSRTQDGFFMEAHPKLRPVDAATGGIFFAGCAEAPKDIKDSVTQASAAAARAGILMAKGKVTVEAITPISYAEKCKACGLCTKVCPYNAITLDKELKRVNIIEAACGGCGTCAAECPFGALTQNHFTDEQILAQVDAVTEQDADKKIVAFCCNWCAYAGADFAGVSRMQYPPNVRIIRTMCSGRVSPKFVERAFARGAAAVLVAGCHPGDCHYINANYHTQKRVEKLSKKMEQNGLNKERLQLLWASAAEGERFASKIREMQGIVEKVTREEIEKAKKVFEKALGGN